MEAAFKIPSDLPLLRPFKDLVIALGSPGKAYHVWYIIWQDMFFRAQEGGPKGRIPSASVPALLRSLSEVEPDEAKCREELFNKAIVADSRLLELDGKDYVCPRFILLNSQLGKGGRESVGGQRRAFLNRQKKVPGQAFEQSLLIPPERFIDGEGKKLEGEQVKRVMHLIISCDNALGKPSRLETDYSEGLIQSALAVLKNYEDEEINIIITKISKKRDHPALNEVNTEKLLPVFEAKAREIN